MVWRTTWLGTERREGSTKQAARPVGEVNAGRSQSPNSTANGEVSRTVETCVRAKGALGKWGRKVDSQGPERAEMKVEASRVSATTRRDASALGSSMQRKFAPAPIWIDAMLAALQRGVRGGKWHNHQHWRYAFFADLGLFTKHEAHRLARQPRCGNN